MAELDIVLDQMNEGFRRLHEQIASQNAEYNRHITTCFNRFANLEQAAAVKSAAGAEREKYNYWPIIIRASLIFLTGAALMWIYRITEHIDKVKP